MPVAGTVGVHIRPPGRSHDVHLSDSTYYGVMASLTEKISTAVARTRFAEVVSRTQYAGERIGLTRKGKLSAVLISVEDFEAFEQYEMECDIAAFDAAIAEDDGTRVTLEQMRAELDEIVDDE